MNAETVKNMVDQCENSGDPHAYFLVCISPEDLALRMDEKKFDKYKENPELMKGLLEDLVTALHATYEEISFNRALYGELAVRKLLPDK